MKHRIVLLVILLILLGVPMIANRGNNIDGPYASIIHQGINLYTPERLETMSHDDLWLLQKIADKTPIVPDYFISTWKKKYKDDPLYKRFITKNAYDPSLRFIRHMDKVGTFDFYTITYRQEDLPEISRIVAKAFYCDKTGYDDFDFRTLASTLKEKGGYYDTHYLIGLLFLKEFHCYKQDVIEKEIEYIATNIIRDESNDKQFGDLYAERIVVLYWAGYGKFVKKEWIDKVAKNFNKEYGWVDEGHTTFYGHTTGHALLSLIYYTEGKNRQPFF